MFNKKSKILFALIVFFSPAAFTQPCADEAHVKTANHVIKIFDNRPNWSDKCVCCDFSTKPKSHLVIKTTDQKPLTELAKLFAQRGPYEEVIDFLRQEELKSAPRYSSLKRELDWAFPPIGMTYKHIGRHPSVPYCLQ